MPTVQDLAAQLCGETPGLPFLFARNYINQALNEIARERLWSWNINEGMLIIPQLISAGAADLTKFSAGVQFDAAAKAALDAVALANPPLISRQFRAGNGPIYNLVAYDTATGIGTLDRLYIETTATGQSYQVYKCYYGPPTINGTDYVTDFLRYLSILDPINGYSISGKNLTMTREQLNRRDPMRGSQGQPYYLASYRPTPNQMGTGGTIPRGATDGIMQYEFWPHPIFGQQLLAQYERQNLNLAFTDYLPADLEDSLVRYKAQEFCFRWAQQNVGRIPELKGVNWPLLLAEVQNKYSKELVGAKRNDDERLIRVIRPGTSNIMNFFGPVDSNWAQSHGVMGWN